MIPLCVWRPIRWHLIGGSTRLSLSFPDHEHVLLGVNRHGVHVMDLKDSIRTIPDFPKAGIQFRDVTTLMGNPRAFRQAVDQLVQPYAGSKIDKVAGIEARGFILGGAVAHQLSAGFVPLRKKGKLPHHVITESYELEYGVDAMEMHTDAISPEDRVLLVDDLIATGGTALAAVKLLRKAGAKIAGAAFLVCLPELQGDSRLAEQGIDVSYLVWFSGH